MRAGIMSLDTFAVERRPIAEASVTISLPVLPPSTNNLYVNVPGKGRVRTAEYNRWLNSMGLLVNAQTRGCFAVPVTIEIQVEDSHPLRDASNVIKPCEDLLCKIGVVQDDRAKYVRKVSAEWASVEGVKVTVRRCAA